MKLILYDHTKFKDDSVPLSFQSFGRILGYHDENCMKKAKYH